MTATRGPWRVSFDARGGIGVVSYDSVVAIVKTEKGIPTADDDARLIALAPELLEALRNRDEAHHARQKYEFGLTDQLTCGVCALIAKAEGK